jgi:predicted O-methyltransferase YrrM
MGVDGAARLREVRSRLFDAGVIVGPDGTRRELFPVAIGEAEGSVLRAWVRDEGAVRTLETGLGYAMSTLFICEGLLENGPDVHHVAADPHQFAALPNRKTRFEGAGLELLEEAGVRDLVEFHAEESQILLPRLLAEGRRFDLAFLDGNHRFEGVFLDLIYSGRLLKDAGIVFVDDTQLPGVRRAVEFCRTNLGWTVEDEGSEGDAHAWTVLRTGPIEVFERPFTHFADF